MNAGRAGTAAQRRLLALERANHIRNARADLKRRLRAGEAEAADVILRGSHDTDTMTVRDLLSSQSGWGPVRGAKVLRSVSLSEQKTLGSLTGRQRLTLAAALSIDEGRRRTIQQR
jgi:hypothetical protein